MNKTTWRHATLVAVMAVSLALPPLTATTVFAQASHYDELANLPFPENLGPKDTAQTLRDELLFQRATQVYLLSVSSFRKNIECFSRSSSCVRFCCLC